MALPCALCCPLSRNASADNFVPRKTPVKFTPQRRCQSASVASSRLMPRKTPALLTRMSRPPKRSVTAAIAVVQSSSRVTSRRVYIASPPALSIARTVSRPRSSSTSPTATFAPASAIRRAVSAPIPRAAPEISATLPSRRFITAPRTSIAKRDSVAFAWCLVHRQHSSASPSPPFRGEREGPVAQRWEGEVGGAADPPPHPDPLRPRGRRERGAGFTAKLPQCYDIVVIVSTGLRVGGLEPWLKVRKLFS